MIPIRVVHNTFQYDNPSLTAVECFALEAPFIRSLSPALQTARKSVCIQVKRPFFNARWHVKNDTDIKGPQHAPQPL